MCKRCVDAIRKHWPDLPESKYHMLLMGATGWPCVPAAVVVRQVEEMAERSGCDLEKAMGLAEEDTERAIKGVK